MQVAQEFRILIIKDTVKDQGLIDLWHDLLLPVVFRQQVDGVPLEAVGLEWLFFLKHLFKIITNQKFKKAFQPNC